MSWKHFAYLTLLIAALTAVKFFMGETARWLALLGLFGLGYIATLVARRRWRRRVDSLRSASPEEVDAVLADLPPEERAALRLQLGYGSDAESLTAEDDLEFRYPRTPALLREVTFWASAAIALFAYVTLLASWDPDERWYTLALGLGFTASVGYQRVAWDRELTTIRVSSAGIEQRSADGTVVALQWSEVNGIRNRRLLMCTDICGADRRRVRVGYTLDGFARLIELTREQSGHE